MIAPVEHDRQSDEPNSILLSDEPSVLRPWTYTQANGDGITTSVSRMIGMYPVAAATAALGLGLAIGWLVKRKLNR